MPPKKKAVARSNVHSRQSLLEAPVDEIFTPMTRVLIIGGSTMCGKTNMLNYVLRKQHGFVGEHPKGVHWTGNNFRFAMSFSKTEPANGNFGGKKVGDHGVVPWMLARGDFDKELLSAYMKYQMRCQGIGRAKPGIIIGDDLMCDKKAVNCPEMLELLMNARNYLVGADMTSHGTKLLDDKARTNFQVIIAFDVGGDKDAEKLYECFFSQAFRKKQSFMRTYRRVLKTPYQAFVFDNRRTGKITNRVFKLRAPDPSIVGRPHLCELGFWQVSAAARKNHLKFASEELFNLDAMRKRLGIKTYKKPATVRASGDSVSVAAGGGRVAGARAGGDGNGDGGDGGDGGDAFENSDTDDSEDGRGLY